MEPFHVRYLFTDWLVSTVVLLGTMASLGLLPIAVAVSIMRKPRSLTTGIDIQAVVFALWGGGWMLFHVIALLTYLVPYMQLKQAYDRREYRISEGIVDVLFEQPREGHAPGDTIRIGATTLEIDAFKATSGYHVTIAQGGLLQQGRHVRVYDYTGVILRIEVKETPPPPNRSSQEWPLHPCFEDC